MTTAPALATSEVLAILQANRVPRDRYPVVAVAIRGYRIDSIGEKGKNDRDRFDDALFIVYPDGLGGDKVLRFNSNTDPAGRAKGRATLVTGIHLFGVGPHNVSKGASKMYPAYRQAEPFTVTRDGYGAQRFTGYFGINLHMAWGIFGSYGATSSLACQTVPNENGPLGWKYFKPTVDGLLAQHGNEKGWNDLGLWAIADGADPATVAKVPILPYVLIDETERRKGNLVVSRRYFPKAA